MMEWSQWTALNVWLSGNVLEKTISQEFLNEGWVNGVKSVEITKWLTCIGKMPFFWVYTILQNICLTTTFQNETVTVSFK